MARLLSPADFGLFAMVMSIAGIAEVFRDFGLSQAAVQAPVLTAQQRSNLFWINSAIGATLAVAVFLSSWGIAALYGQEELAPLAQLASVAFLLNGLATQFRASLNRALRFRALAITDVARCGGRARSRHQRGAGGRRPVGARRPIARRLVRDARARGLLRRLAAGAAATGGRHRRLHPLRMEHGRDADGDLRRQQRRHRRHRSEVRRDAARHLQPCVPARDEHREPVAGTDHQCRGADPLAAPGRGCAVLGLRARRPGGPRVHDRRGARIRHRRGRAGDGVCCSVRAGRRRHRC